MHIIFSRFTLGLLGREREGRGGRREEEQPAPTKIRDIKKETDEHTAKTKAAFSSSARDEETATKKKAQTRK